MAISEKKSLRAVKMFLALGAFVALLGWGAMVGATPVIVASGGIASAVLGLEIDGQFYNMSFAFTVPTAVYPPLFPNGNDTHAAMLTLDDLFVANQIVGVTDGTVTTGFYFLAVAFDPSVSWFPEEVNGYTGFGWENDHASGHVDDVTMWARVQPATAPIAAPEPSATLLVALALVGMGAWRRMVSWWRKRRGAEVSHACAGEGSPWVVAPWGRVEGIDTARDYGVRHERCLMAIMEEGRAHGE